MGGRLREVRLYLKLLLVVHQKCFITVNFGSWLDLPRVDCKNAKASDSQDDESEGQNCESTCSVCGLVSFAAVFGMSRNAPPKETAAHIRTTFHFHFHFRLANHSFRSIFENLVAPNSPFETCPIRDHFLSSHHMVGNSYINNADNGDNCDSWRSLPSRVFQVQYCGPKCLLEACNAENCQREGRYLRYCAIR